MLLLRILQEKKSSNIIGRKSSCSDEKKSNQSKKNVLRGKIAHPTSSYYERKMPQFYKNKVITLRFPILGREKSIMVRIKLYCTRENVEYDKICHNFTVIK